MGSDTAHGSRCRARFPKKRLFCIHPMDIAPNSLNIPLCRLNRKITFHADVPCRASCGRLMWRVPPILWDLPHHGAIQRIGSGLVWKVSVGLEQDGTPMAAGENRSPRLKALEWLAVGFGVYSEADMSPVSSTTPFQACSNARICGHRFSRGLNSPTVFLLFRKKCW